MNDHKPAAAGLPVEPPQRGTSSVGPTVVSRPDHKISRANISRAALNVLYTLKKGGFEAYLVGGAVRDLLLGREPKDFDVATDARPEQIKELFRSCRLIGRRFRLAHVRFGREVIEVATFRGGHDGERDGEGMSVEGRIVRDNVYGTLEEDAWRRDLSVNALYYTIDDFSVIDYTGGLADLQAQRLQLIGDPFVRCREDPVRMLRAVRFAAKLGFDIHPDTEAPIRELGELIDEAPSARLFDEVLKLFLGGCARDSFELLHRYELLGHLFPATARCLRDAKQPSVARLLECAMANTDERIAAEKPVTPAFLFAALLWEPLRRRTDELCRLEEMSEAEAMRTASHEVIDAQVIRVALPRRFSMVTREIWSMQPRLVNRRGQRHLQLAQVARFRAAYDFLLLRAQAGEPVDGAAKWWTDFQAEATNGDERVEPVDESARPRPRRRRRRRRKADE